jgi:hypothetical protein
MEERRVIQCKLTLEGVKKVTISCIVHEHSTSDSCYQLTAIYSPTLAHSPILSPLYSLKKKRKKKKPVEKPHTFPFPRETRPDGDR